MDKKLLFILIASILTLALLIFFVATGWDYFVGKEAPQPITQGKCGDGICDEKEKANANLCPKDCEKKTEGICEDLCGDGTCQEVVCLAIGCPCAETAESCPKDCKTTTTSTTKTCSEQKGTSCSSSQTCSGSWISASDSQRCCSGTCKTETTTTPTSSDNSLDADGFMWGTEPLLDKIDITESAIDNTLKTKYLKIRVAINSVSEDKKNFSSTICLPSIQNCRQQIDMDEAVKKFKSNNWSMIPMLSYGYHGIQESFSSADIENYVNFVDWFVSRYKNDANIKYVELENCPNCQSSLSVSNELLVETTNKIYDKIKGKYPDILMGTPGFEYWVDNTATTAMIEYFLDKSNGAKFDFWAFHGYPLSEQKTVGLQHTPPTRTAVNNKYAGVKGIAEIRKKLDANGWQDRLIIDTESGPYFTGSPSTYTESVQKTDAAVLVQDSLLKRVQQANGKTALAGRLPLKFYPRTDTRATWDGSLNSDGSATYAVKAVALLWSKLNEYNYDSHISGEFDNENQVWIEKFKSGSKELYIFFKPFKYVSGQNISFDNETLKYTLTLNKKPSKITLTDTYGNVSSITSATSITLEAINAPKFLEVEY